jgi:hypothetical protein
VSASCVERAKAAWISRSVALFGEVSDHTRIINVSESCGRGHPSVLQIWAATGSQNVRITIGSNEKDSFTVVLAITLARSKLPLCSIATKRHRMWRNYLLEMLASTKLTTLNQGRKHRRCLPADSIGYAPCMTTVANSGWCLIIIRFTEQKR